MTITQKDLAKVLDRAAARCSSDYRGERPASSKQCWFLAGLAVKADQGEKYAADFDGDMLDAATASTLIDMHLTAAKAA